MEVSALSRRHFISWATAVVSANPMLCEATVAKGPVWSPSSDRRVRSLFEPLVPQSAKHLCTAVGTAVVASVFEVDIAVSSALVEQQRWLCIASKSASGRWSTQVTNEALYASNCFHPFEVDLRIGDDDQVEIGEQGIRSYTTHIWMKVGDEWHLAGRTFAGVCAHELVTERFDAQTRRLETSRAKFEDDLPYFSDSSTVKTVTCMSEYRTGATLA